MAEPLSFSKKQIAASIKSSGIATEASRYFADPRFPELEMDYKLRLAKSIREAHLSYCSNDPDWRGAMEAAIRSNENNLVNWRVKAEFGRWIHKEESAGRIIDVLIRGKNDLELRLNRFGVSLGEGGIEQTGAQLVLASVLLMSSDISQNPPVRTNVLRDTLKRLKLNSSVGTATLAQRYSMFMTILDAIVEASGKDGHPMTSRLEAQGAIWCVLDGRMDIDTRGRGTRSKDSNEPAAETQKPAVIVARIGQSKYRSGLVAKWLGCSVTGCQRYQILRASHLKPWSESNDQERLDVHNGLLLVPNLDALLDQYLISFESNGKILISASLPDIDRKLLGVHSKMKIVISNSKIAPYLTHHRTAYKKLEASRTR